LVSLEKCLVSNMEKILKIDWWTEMFEVSEASLILWRDTFSKLYRKNNLKILVLAYDQSLHKEYKPDVHFYSVISPLRNSVIQLNMQVISNQGNQYPTFPFLYWIFSSDPFNNNILMWQCGSDYIWQKSWYGCMCVLVFEFIRWENVDAKKRQYWKKQQMACLVLGKEVIFWDIEGG
jgi:hypothetical protein